MLWNGFFSNLVPIWLQLGPQNLPKMEPSWFPIGVQQGNAQNRQNVHGAEARARFSRILGSQVGTKICKKTDKKNIGNRTQIGMSLGWLSASILDDFGGKLGAKMRPKIAKMRSQSRSKNCTKKCTKKWLARDATVCSTRGGSVLNNQ